MRINQGHDFLVHLTTKHHLHHIHGFGIGYPHAVDESGLDVQTLQQLADLRATAMDNDRVDAYKFHQHHIAGKTALQVFVFHGVTAVLDDHGLAGKSLNIRQAPAKYRSYLHCCFTIQRHVFALLILY